MPNATSSPCHFTGRLQVRVLRLMFSTSLALAIVTFGGWLFGQPTPVYSAGGEVCFATLNGTLVYSSTDASAVQNAVSAAAPGATVKVAGTCAGVQTINNTTQVVIVTQTLTLAGGYTVTDWLNSYPEIQPTILDAQKGGRVLYATVDLGMQNLTLQNGADNMNNGAGAYVQGNVALTQTNFYSNTATGTSAFGGGLYANGGTVSITGGTFAYNTAGMNGGGAFTYGNASIADVTFLDNNAFYGGGAYFYGGATVTGATFTGNAASMSGGGAIFGAGATVANAVFTDNIVHSGSSGGGGGADFQQAANVTNTTFTGNSADQGGGVYFENVGNARRFVNVLLAGNTAFINGAAVYVKEATPLELIHTTIANPALASNQAIYVAAGTTYLTNTIVANYAVGIEQAGGAITADHTLFFGNTLNTTGTVTSTNEIIGDPAFVNSDAGDYHLGLGSAAIDVAIDAGVYSDFEGDIRPQGNGYDVGYDEYPAVNPATCTGSGPANPRLPLTGVTLWASPNGSASQECGGQSMPCTLAYALTRAQAGDTLLLAAGQYTTSLTLEPERLVIQGQGAGQTFINAVAGQPVLKLTQCADVTLQDLTLRRGTGTSCGSASFTAGGGVCNLGRLDLVQVTVADSTAQVGGGLANLGQMTVLSSTVQNNTAQNGGGVANLGQPGAPSVLTLTASTAFSNTAWQYGGGLFNNTGLLTIERSAVISNLAQLDGGGLYNYDETSRPNSVMLTAVNSTFGKNRAYGHGGGLYNNAGQVRLQYVTVAENKADFNSDLSGQGGGIYSASAASVNTSGAILLGNSGVSSGTNGDCYQVVSTGYNLTGVGSGCGFSLTGDTTQEGALTRTVWSLTQIGSAWVYPVVTTGAAYNAAPQGAVGCGSSLSVDQVGTIRPQGNACEKGAYEQWASSARVTLATAADLGFRPSLQGYGFPAYALTLPGELPATDVLIDLFGADLVCKTGTLSPDGRSCVVDANMAAALGDYVSGQYGQAYGMAVTALRFYMGLDQLPDVTGLTVPPPITDPTLLASSNLAAHIARYTLQQMTRPIGAPDVWVRNPTVTEAVDLLNSELALGLDVADPYLLVLYAPNQTSHVVAPYRVVPAGAGIYDVYVYDPFFPLDDGRVVHFDETAHTWTYATTLPGTSTVLNLSGQTETSRLDLRHLSSHRHADTRLNGDVTLATAQCLTAGAGGCPSLPTLTTALRCSWLPNGQGGARQVCAADANQPLGVSLYPNTSGQQALSLINQAGDVVRLSAGGVSGAGARLALGLSADGHTLTVTSTESAATLSLIASVRGHTPAQPSHVVTLNGAQLVVGSVAQVQLDAAQGRLCYHTSVAGGTYALQVERFNADGSRQVFVASQVNLGAVACLDMNSWDGVNAMPMYVDGSTVPTLVTNQNQRVYLPLVRR